MILVLSYEDFEQCTDPVLDWLLYYNAKFLKITYKDIYYSDNDIQFDINNKKLVYNGVDLTEEVSTVYYRRFATNVKIPELRNGFPTDQARYEVTNEMEHLIKYFYFLLEDKIWFPYPKYVDIDKLTSLTMAKEAGLSIPRSTVSNNKRCLSKFVEEVPASITKPIKFSGYYIADDGYTYTVLTNIITQKSLSEIKAHHFFPTLVQERINYQFEIRIFYLDGDFYAAAIIVPNSIYTDVKRHFGKAEIHWVPFQLPKTIENKLHKFMQSIKLNTGSIDMMKTKDGEYVFIEVNPVGQFIAPSRRCNFKIEKKIAEWLINKSNEKR